LLEGCNCPAIVVAVAVVAVVVVGQVEKSEKSNGAAPHPTAGRHRCSLDLQILK